jgi:hypothetical protein
MGGWNLKTVFLIVGLISLGSLRCFAEIDVDRLADAIKKAENSKNHPYGILKPYCSGDHEDKCRKGCIQTINRRLKMWDGEGDFIEYLGRTYSPPKDNPNWVHNVQYFYNKGD